MDVLRGLNLRGLLRFLDSKSDEELVRWLQEADLLHSSRKCPSCQTSMKFYERMMHGKEKPTFLWRCSNSRRCKKRPTIGFYQGTFFEEHKLSLHEILLFSYYWVHKMSDNITLSRKFRRDDGTTLGKESAALYRKLFSDVCMEFFLRNPIKIGGPNVVVEVDESLVVSKRKYNVGRIPVDGRIESRQWFFGGVERGSRAPTTQTKIPCTSAKPLERQVSADIPDHSVTHFSTASSSSGEIQFARPVSFHTTASKIACKSVCNDEEGPHILKYAPPRVRKSSGEYGRLNSSYNESKPAMRTDRRLSLQVQQNEEVAKRKVSTQVLQNPGALAVQKKSAKRGNTAVRGVDFFQIPVQMLTPSTVGIINKGFDESPSSPKDFTEVNIDK